MRAGRELPRWPLVAWGSEASEGGSCWKVRPEWLRGKAALGLVTDGSCWGKSKGAAAWSHDIIATMQLLAFPSPPGTRLPFHHIPARHMSTHNALQGARRGSQRDGTAARSRQ